MKYNRIRVLAGGCVQHLHNLPPDLRPRTSGKRCLAHEQGSEGISALPEQSQGHPGSD